MSWLATTKGPIKTKKALDDVVMHSGDKRKKQTKAQYEAAIQAAGHLVAATDEPVNVTLSGNHDEDQPTQIQVVVLGEDKA